MSNSISISEEQARLIINTALAEIKRLDSQRVQIDDAINKQQKLIDDLSAFNYSDEKRQRRFKWKPVIVEMIEAAERFLTREEVLEYYLEVAPSEVLALGEDIIKARLTGTYSKMIGGDKELTELRSKNGSKVVYGLNSWKEENGFFGWNYLSDLRGIYGISAFDPSFFEPL